MQNALAPPEELHVYECWGPRSPDREPCFEGFLGLWPEPLFYYLFTDRQALSWVCQVLKTDAWQHAPWILLSGFLEAQWPELLKFITETMVVWRRVALRD
jgi:hypothetical protein